MRARARQRPDATHTAATTEASRGRRRRLVGGVVRSRRGCSACLAVGLLVGSAKAATRPRRRRQCTSSAPGGVLSTACDTRTPTAPLTGAGANSISPFFTRAFYDYNQANHGVTVNYTPAGSSVGVTDIEQNTVQFGDSEVPIPAPASGSGGDHPADPRRPRRRGPQLQPARA